MTRALLLLLVGLAVTAASAQTATVRVENPTETPRPDEVVAVRWDALQRRVPQLAPGRVRALDNDGAEVPVQAFDADGDGTTDELLLLVSLWPGQSREYRIEATPAASAAPRAHVYHDERRDDVAWENDRVAFRTYGKGLSALEDLVSSGVDVWTKRTHDLVLDRWYAEDDYHHDAGEGADFYSVGPSLGAGGTAIWADGRLWRAPNFSDYRVIADGPLRAVVEMDHGPFDAAGAEARETRRVTIDAGRPLFRLESTVSAPDVEVRRIATGVVDRPGLVTSTGEAGGWTWLSTWGPVATQNGGHGDLGAAVLTRTDRLADVTDAAGHHLLILEPPPASPAVVYVATSWTAAGEVGGPEDWWTLLDAEADRLARPLRVSVETAPLDARAALDAAADRLRPFLDRPAVDGQIPRSLDADGALDASSARAWTSGFYPGTLWLLSEATGDDAFADAARQWTAVVEPEKRNGGTHDMGFKIYTSAGNALRLTGEDHYRDVVVEAADTLMTRFDPGRRRDPVVGLGDVGLPGHHRQHDEPGAALRGLPDYGRRPLRRGRDGARADDAPQPLPRGRELLPRRPVRRRDGRRAREGHAPGLQRRLGVERAARRGRSTASRWPTASRASPTSSPRPSASPTSS